MRVASLFGIGLTVGALASAGCAAGGKNKTTGTGGSTGGGGTSAGGSTGGGGATGGGGTGGSTGGSSGGSAGAGGLNTGGSGGGEACAKFTAEANQAPAALLFALDMSGSMTTQNKWGTAQLSTVAAIDADVFDSMTLGVVTFPTSTVTGPDCIFNFQVTCGVSALPQVAMAPAGKDKSNAPSGVRHDIYQYLSSHAPLNSMDDGSPIYDGMAAGYAALELQKIERRILVVITDGGFSCTSLSNRTGYLDGNGCSDWEIPDTVNDLIIKHRTDPVKPIYTFIVGLPGSNSSGNKDGPYDTPPYHMKLALSTYAVNGSPDTVDPACSKDAKYVKNGGDPALPCHIDLSSGNAFNPDALATAIQTIRGKALGCVYDLPTPPDGQTIDKDFVNVTTTLDGTASDLKKRKDPNDNCAADGCWDYNVGGQVQILGKSCEDLSKATKATVDIKVGCMTIIK